LRLLFYQNFQVVRLNTHFVAQGLAGALFGVLVGGFVAKNLRAHAYKKLVPLSVFVLGVSLLLL
ncbi:MAG: hypothetical protein D6699_03335, partial [Aquificota bacterium]